MLLWTPLQIIHRPPVCAANKVHCKFSISLTRIHYSWLQMRLISLQYSSLSCLCKLNIALCFIFILDLQRVHSATMLRIRASGAASTWSSCTTGEMPQRLCSYPGIWKTSIEMVCLRSSKQSACLASNKKNRWVWKAISLMNYILLCRFPGRGTEAYFAQAAKTAAGHALKGESNFNVLLAANCSDKWLHLFVKQNAMTNGLHEEFKKIWQRAQTRCRHGQGLLAGWCNNLHSCISCLWAQADYPSMQWRSWAKPSRLGALQKEPRLEASLQRKLHPHLKWAS